MIKFIWHLFACLGMTTAITAVTIVVRDNYDAWRASLEQMTIGVGGLEGVGIFAFAFVLVFLFTGWLWIMVEG